MTRFWVILSRRGHDPVLVFKPYSDIESAKLGASKLIRETGGTAYVVKELMVGYPEPPPNPPLPPIIWEDKT